VRKKVKRRANFFHFVDATLQKIKPGSHWDDQITVGFIQCDNGDQDPSGIPVIWFPEAVYEVLVELKLSY